MFDFRALLRDIPPDLAHEEAAEIRREDEISDFERIQRRQNKLPVDVEGLARDLGYQVEARDMGAALLALVEDEWPRKLLLAPSLAGPRRRYAIAHGVAHAMLHGDLIQGALYEDAAFRNGFLDDEEERYAHRLALTLLMPEGALRAWIGTLVSSAEICRRLDVDEPTLQLMLGILGLPYVD